MSIPIQHLRSIHQTLFQFQKEVVTVLQLLQEELLLQEQGILTLNHGQSRAQALKVLLGVPINQGRQEGPTLRVLQEGASKLGVPNLQEANGHRAVNQD